MYLTGTLRFQCFRALIQDVYDNKYIKTKIN